VVPPLQAIVHTVELAVKAVGCVILKVCVKVQPAGELIVQMYEPAQRFTAVAVVCGFGFHK